MERLGSLGIGVRRLEKSAFNAKKSRGDPTCIPPLASTHVHYSYIVHEYLLRNLGNTLLASSRAQVVPKLAIRITQPTINLAIQAMLRKF